MKGYEQVPGKDYTESFSLVAIDSTVQTMICLCLFCADGHNGLKYKMDMTDIEAAFLKGDIDKILNGLSECFNLDLSPKENSMKVASSF
jgi:flagellar motor switch protein FliM